LVVVSRVAMASLLRRGAASHEAGVSSVVPAVRAVEIFWALVLTIARSEAR